MGVQYVITENNKNIPKLKFRDLIRVGGKIRFEISVPSKKTLPEGETGKSRLAEIIVGPLSLSVLASRYKTLDHIEISVLTVVREEQMEIPIVSQKNLKFQVLRENTEINKAIRHQFRILAMHAGELDIPDQTLDIVWISAAARRIKEADDEIAHLEKQLAAAKKKRANLEVG